MSMRHFQRRSWGIILGPVAAPQLIQLWPAVTLFAVRSFTRRRVGQGLSRVVAPCHSCSPSAETSVFSVMRPRGFSCQGSSCWGGEVSEHLGKTKV